MKNWENMSDAELDAELMKNMKENPGAGAKAFEEWLAGPYKKLWHETWNKGRVAQEQGKSREDNPEKLKIWKAVWEYGWDNYDPNMPLEYKKVEQHLNDLPTRSMKDSDL